jgi:hypothetical protein
LLVNNQILKERIAAENHLRTDHNSWPRSVDALTKRLKIISSNLREGLGIYVAISKVRSGNKKGLSVTRVWKNALHAPHPYQTTFEHDFMTVEDIRKEEESDPIEQTKVNPS